MLSASFFPRQDRDLCRAGWLGPVLGSCRQRYGRVMTTGNTRMYVAEMIDGPLQGSVEERRTVDGGFERELRPLITVDGLPSVQVYEAFEDAVLNGQLWVKYRFAKARSDAYTVDACRPNWGAEGIRA